MCCKSLLFLHFFWWQCHHFDFRKRMGFTCIFENDGEKVAKNDWKINSVSYLDYKGALIGGMDFANPKLFSDISIFDGLVFSTSSLYRKFGGSSFVLTSITPSFSFLDAWPFHHLHLHHLLQPLVLACHCRWLGPYSFAVELAVCALLLSWEDLFLFQENLPSDW